MLYSYVAYNRRNVVKGRLEAASPSEARAKVVGEGYKPIRITTARKTPGLEELFPSLYRVSPGELVRFSRQLATMLGSSASLIRTLEMLGSETRNRVLRRTIASIREQLDEGISLSTALAQHPKVFSPLFVSVIEVGESTGRLGVALEQMAEILQKEYEARQKAMSTMMYPLAIVGMSMVTLFVLMTVALPPLLKVFEQMGGEMPLMTRIAVGGVTALKVHFLKIPVITFIVIVAYRLLRRIPKVTFALDNARAKAPILGSFTITGEIARFARTVGMLLEAGVALSAALELGIKGCKNMAIRKAFVDADESLLSGQGLAEALRRHSILPSMFVQLVAVGEESNSLKRTMADVATAYQKQYEQSLSSLLSLLEPVSTVIVGAIVGFIALAMFLPIYSGLNALG